MSRRAAGRLAWNLVGLFTLLELWSLWEVVTGRGRADEVLLLTVGFAGFAPVGALVASRRPGNAVGWLLLTIGIAFAVTAFGEVYLTDRSNPAFEAVAWFVAAWSWLVWPTLAAVFLPLVFPNGRLLSKRWRAVPWMGGVGLALTVIGAVFEPGHLPLTARVENPLGVEGAAAELAAIAVTTGGTLIAVAVPLAVASLVVRFRGAGGVERQQLKWFASAVLLMVAGLGLAFLGVLFPDGWREVVGDAAWYIFLFAFQIGIPAATGIAILRHRLYDIDVVINRTLVYGALTVTLAASYLGLVLVFRTVLGPVTGESELAVAGSTLAVAALFRPLRSRIQQVVDRRFYRSRYDAARTLETFSAHLRDELDLESMGTDLRSVVHDTMQPAHVSLWLREAVR